MIRKTFKNCLSFRVEEMKSEVNKYVRTWTTGCPPVFCISLYLHLYMYCCYWYHYGCEYTTLLFHLIIYLILFCLVASPCISENEQNVPPEIPRASISINTEEIVKCDVSVQVPSEDIVGLDKWTSSTLDQNVSARMEALKVITDCEHSKLWRNESSALMTQTF